MTKKRHPFVLGEAAASVLRLFRKTSTVYIALATVLTTSFLVLNRIYDGLYFESMFYGLLNDANLDFYVFLTGDSLNRYSYFSGKGINPPLVKLIMSWISSSIPSTLFDEYAKMNVFEAAASLDPRANAYLSLCFVMFMSVSMTLMGVVVFVGCRGNIFRRVLVTVSLLYSVGVVFAVERGNMVLLAGSLLLVFLMTLECEDVAAQEIGMICYALAVAIKIYPVVFGVLLIGRRRKNQLVRAAVFVLLFTLGPFLWFGGLRAFWGFLVALLNNADGQGGIRPGSFNGVSLALTLFRLLGVERRFEILVPYIRFASYGMAFLLVACAFILRPLWQQTLALCLATLLLPGLSPTYMLVFINGPLLLFLNEDSKIDVRAMCYIICFVGLTALIPLLNGDLTLSLRSEADIPNRLTSMMLVHQLCQITLMGLIVSDAVRGLFGEHQGNDSV